MANKAKRRFVGLDVGEISFVDSAANEEEFLILKRFSQKEDDVPDKTKTEATTADVEKGSAEEKNAPADGGAEKVSVEVEAAGVTKAMDKVTSLVESIAKAAGVKTDATETEAKPAAETATTEALADDVDVEKNAAAKAALLKAGFNEAQAKAAMAAAKALHPEGHKVKKAADPEPAPAVDPEQAMADFLVSSVSKAKAFTPKRQAALKAALDTLKGLLDDVDPQGSQVGTKKSVAGDADDPVVALTKSVVDLGEAMKESLGKVSEVQKSFGTRLESIEKTRANSSSVDGDGGTDKQEDVKKSFWAGVSLLG